MSMGYDATASLQPLNYTTSFTNPAQWTMGNNAWLNQYSQGVQGQILQDTQRSLTANADRMMQWTLSPSAGYYGEGGGGNSPWSGGTGGVFDERNAGSGATMAQLQQPWLTPSGGVNNIISGGGMYQGPSPFSSGGYGGPTIDWGGVGMAAAGLGGMSGGTRDPYPNMSMPGGLNSPMTMPQQQPLDYGSLFGRGAGGMGGAPQQSPYTSGIEPDQTGGRTYPGALDAPMEGAPSSSLDWSTLFPKGDPAPGMAMPGGLNSPMTTPEPGASFGERFDAVGGSAPMGDGTRTYDFAPMFEGGGGGGFGTGGADTSQLFGAEATGQGGNAFSYNPQPSGGQDVFGQSADKLAEQARGELASLMGSGDTQAVETAGGPTGRTAESAREAGGAVPPAARPAETTPGRQEALAALKKELQANDLIMTSGYRGPEHPLSQANPNSAHSQGRAFDVRARTPEAADTAIGQIRQLLGARGLEEGRDYRIIDEVRHPSGWATGPHVHTQFTEEGVQRYQQGVYRDPNEGQVIPRPPADIPYPNGVPTPAERPAEAPARPEAPAAAPLEQGTGVNQGQEIPRPPVDIPPPGLVGPGYNALDAAANAPVKHSGLELARANIDTPIEQIARERFGQKGVDEVSSMVRGMTPRQIYESYGGMFTSRAEPLFKGLGITRQDFEKAVTMPQAKQDLKMRYGEGDFGPYPAYTGPEAVPGGTAGWALPMPSTLHPDITDERGQLANTMSQDLLGYTPQQWPDEAYPQSVDNVVGPRSSASGFEPGGFGEGGYGNAFTPGSTSGPGLDSSTWNAGRDRTISGATEPTTNLAPGDLMQRTMGDPFNPSNYNTLDQALDLVTARAPFMEQINRDPVLMNKLKALAVSEIGQGQPSEQYAAFFESVLNQSAARNKSDLDAFLNSGYYQPVNQGTLGPSYKYLTDNPAMRAEIGRMISEAGAGSNVSNLAMENSSYDPQHPEFGPGAMSPQYGGFLNQFLPGSSEYLTSKLNPFNDPAAAKYIGAGAQQQYRDFWQRMMPTGTEPWIRGP